jgi:hypothetical protein
MRPNVNVVMAPGLGDRSCLVPRCEPMLAQALGPELANERFNVWILSRPAGREVAPFYWTAKPGSISGSQARRLSSQR